MHCVVCTAPISRGELLAWAGRCDDCAARPDGLSPEDLAYAALRLRLALWHVRMGVPFVAYAGRRYVFEEVA